MDLRLLWRQDFSVEFAFAMRQRWKTGDVYRYRPNTRPDNGLIYYLNSTYLYEFETGEKKLVFPGDFYFLSKNARYVATCVEGNGKDISALLVNFHISDEQGRDYYPDEPMLFLDSYPRDEAEKKLRRLNDLYYAREYAIAEIKGILYQLLAEVSRQLDREGQPTLDPKLQPALQWLEQHYHEEVSVPDLAAMCCMSESGFRKRFTEKMGVSPVQYRMERRIEQAKRLMQTSSLPIGQIALLVGFDDLNYFCRVFRKSTGMSTRKYMKF